MSLVGQQADAGGGRVLLVADGIYLRGQSDTNHDAVYDHANNCLAAAPGVTGSGTVSGHALITSSQTVFLPASVVLPVSTVSAAVTVSLATLGLRTGTIVTVVDVGGSAATNAITVSLGGTHKFEDGTSSKQITTNYGRASWVVDLLRSPNEFLSTETQ